MSALRISTDRAEVDIPRIHKYLATQSSWSRGIPLETFERAVQNSLCFSGFLGTTQAAFCRVITDYATFANLVDVFVFAEYRNKGYSKEMVKAVVDHPQLQGLRRFTLATVDAHGLYEQFGFTPPLSPQSLMERYFPGIYEPQKKR